MGARLMCFFKNVGFSFRVEVQGLASEQTNILCNLTFEV